jgi:2''-5'' RNA ligase
VTYSLNVPLPGAIYDRLHGLLPHLSECSQRRRDPTLVCKRIPTAGQADPPGVSHLRTELAPAVAAAGAVLTDGCPVTIRGVDTFDAPPGGAAPVLYLGVDSPALQRLHAALCGHLEPVAGLEATAYVPHVTVARGCPPSSIDGAVTAGVEPLSFHVDALELYDSRHRAAVTRFALP